MLVSVVEESGMFKKVTKLAPPPQCPTSKGPPLVSIAHTRASQPQPYHKKGRKKHRRRSDNDRFFFQLGAVYSFLDINRYKQLLA